MQIQPALADTQRTRRRRPRVFISWCKSIHSETPCTQVAGEPFKVWSSTPRTDGMLLCHCRMSAHTGCALCPRRDAMDALRPSFIHDQLQQPPRHMNILLSPYFLLTKPHLSNRELEVWMYTLPQQHVHASGNCLEKCSAFLPRRRRFLPHSEKL